MARKEQMKRFIVCKLPGPAEGKFEPEKEALDGADFDTKPEALAFVGVFPGDGHGYIYDSHECRSVHIFSWERRLPAN